MEKHVNKAPLTIAAATLLALAGCKVGPNYTGPKSSTTPPDAFTHTGPEGFNPASTLDPTKAVSADWWKMLGDPVLDDLIKRAAVGNLDVRIAAARIREARAQRGVIAPEALPQVDVNGSAERQRQSKNTAQGSIAGGRAYNLFQGGFDASWELDFFGRVSRNVEAAEADIGAAVEDQRDVLVTLVGEVARNYVDLRGSQQRLAIARKNIDLQRSTLDLTKKRFAAGIATDLDVAQAESSLATVESAVPSLDTAVQQSIHRIGVLLGRLPTDLMSELTPVAAIPAAPASLPVGLPSELLRRRPDIRRAEREVAASTARIGVATADLYPRFSLTGSFGFAAEKVPSLADASSRFWSFGPAVSWPVLDWGRIRSNIAVQDARTEQALGRYEKAVLGSFEDVENAMVAFTREQARRRSLEAALASDRRSYEDASRLYAAGLTDFQRVLDSQRSLFASEDAFTDSTRAVTSDLVALYKALGGGWETFTPEQPYARPRLHPSSHWGNDDTQAAEPHADQADKSMK